MTRAALFVVVLAVAVLAGCESRCQYFRCCAPPACTHPTLGGA